MRQPRNIVVPQPESVLIFRSIGQSNKSGFAYLGHLVFNMLPASTSEIAFPFIIPSNWLDKFDLVAVAYGIENGNQVPGGNYRFEWGVESKEHGELIEDIEIETVTFTQAAFGQADTYNVSDSQEIDKSNLKASDHLNLTFRRLGGDVLDTRNGFFRLFGVSVEFRRKTFKVCT
jgi:hypothetical protein